MKTSHEWSPPPSTLKSRRQLTCESLASVDWHRARRYVSYSDGDDELLHTREPLEAACQSSAYGEGIGIQDFNGKDVPSSGCGEEKEIHVFEEDVHNGGVQEVTGSGCIHKDSQSSGYGDGKDLAVPSSGYGDGKDFVVPSITPKIGAVDREGQTNVWANRKLKVAGRPHSVQFVDPALVAIEESPVFDSREPISPEVTCLGRVKIKEKHSHDSEHARLGCVRIKEKPHVLGMEQQNRSRQAVERRKQSVDKNGKDGSHKSSSKREIAEKTSCLRMRKPREDTEPRKLKLFRTSSDTVLPSEMAVETRRERAAVLARSLTSLLEDLRHLEMEDAGYVPVVPPSNSLLLMRGFGKFKESSTLLSKNDESSADAILLHDSKTQKGMKLMQTSPENPSVSFSLSEIQSRFLVPNASAAWKPALNTEPLARGKSCPPQELALWQRRAIAKLATIDTNRPMRMEIKKPSTN